MTNFENLVGGRLNQGEDDLFGKNLLLRRVGSRCTCIFCDLYAFKDRKSSQPMN